jgi:hypothetical protein
MYLIKINASKKYFQKPFARGLLRETFAQSKMKLAIKLGAVKREESSIKSLASHKLRLRFP